MDLNSASFKTISKYVFVIWYVIMSNYTEIMLFTLPIHSPMFWFTRKLHTIYWNLFLKTHCICTLIIFWKNSEKVRKKILMTVWLHLSAVLTSLYCMRPQADMSGDRAIRRDEGERLARVSISFTAVQSELMWLTHCSLSFAPLPSCLQEYSVPFMETSAKTGVNVELAFTAVAKYEPIIQLLLISLTV